MSLGSSSGRGGWGGSSSSSKSDTRGGDRSGGDRSGDTFGGGFGSYGGLGKASNAMGGWGGFGTSAGTSTTGFSGLGGYNKMDGSENIDIKSALSAAMQDYIAKSLFDSLNITSLSQPTKMAGLYETIKGWFTPRNPAPMGTSPYTGPTNTYYGYDPYDFNKEPIKATPKPQR
jgi:hypothetical protein